MKFGGTSLADEDAIENACGIVARNIHRQLIVVVSALAGVTDDLKQVGIFMSEGKLVEALQIVNRLQSQHELLCPNRLISYFHRLRKTLSAVHEHGSLAPHMRDRILAYGEILSSMVFSRRLSTTGIQVNHLDSTQCIITDDLYGEATPIFDKTKQRLAEIVLPNIGQRSAVVMAGFIGATETGAITTLGRNASDLTATIVGAALDAECVQIWTDVNGIMTANPRLVPDAMTIPELSFIHAARLASYGAKLHPVSIAPAEARNIPILVLNSRNPRHPGTRILRCPAKPPTPIVSIASKECEVVTVESNEMEDRAGYVLRLFAVFGKHRVSIDVIDSTSISVQCSIDKGRRTPGLEADLAKLAKVTVAEDQVVISIVLNGSIQALHLVYGALQKIHGAPTMISGNAENITLVVPGYESGEVVRKLHSEFFAPVAVS